MQDKDIYKAFCEREKEIIPLFHFPYWLDIVCGPDNWDVIIVKTKDGMVQGVWPYFKTFKYGISKITQSILTPYLGPIITYPHNIKKRERKYSYETKILTKCIEALPAATVIKQGLHPSLLNWTPFYWKGFRQSTRYTYVLRNIKKQKQTIEGYKSSVKNQIRSAQNIYSIYEEDHVENLYALNKKSYDRNGVTILLTKEKIDLIYNTVLENEYAHIITVKDKQDRPICSCLTVYDRLKAYNLLVGVNKDLRPKGAVQWMLAKAIEKASERVDCFDFEGSMLPEVEPVFRVFGGERVPFSVVSRTPAWFRVLHDIIKGKDYSI